MGTEGIIIISLLIMVHPLAVEERVPHSLSSISEQNEMKKEEMVIE